MDRVQRFAKPLDFDHLEEMLGGARWPTEPLPTEIDINPAGEAISSLDSTLKASAIDAALVEPLHRALPLTRREAADPRVWQWLCVKAFPGLVWRRWSEGAPLPEMLKEALTPALGTRFLARSSLNGISRNTLARLWWAAEQLDDYELARKALFRQDLFQNVFERFFGIYPAAARACLDRFDGRSEDEIRAASRWLQQCASTTVLEGLEESEVAAILDEALAA
jgi:Family of unknown function (DUF6339)